MDQICQHLEYDLLFLQIYEDLLPVYRQHLSAPSSGSIPWIPEVHQEQEQDSRTFEDRSFMAGMRFRLKIFIFEIRKTNEFELYRT
jgi:hypothetical protein